MGFEARCHEIGQLFWFVQMVQVVRRLAAAPRGCMDWRWRGDLLFQMRRVRSSGAAENSEFQAEPFWVDRWSVVLASGLGHVASFPGLALPTRLPPVKLVEWMVVAPVGDAATGGMARE